MAKKKTGPFVALANLENTKGKKFSPGDKVTTRDFTAAVLRRWYAWGRVGDWTEEESDGGVSSDG